MGKVVDEIDGGVSDSLVFLDICKKCAKRIVFQDDLCIKCYIPDFIDLELIYEDR